ncbi:MAG: hypothetical protein M1538_03870 [Candidatus Marsarchaeota archaeon]|jgi:hypothetical protein|nr:hypothetical protein [Candidatus Marsarchaeota archaeon]
MEVIKTTTKKDAIKNKNLKYFKYGIIIIIFLVIIFVAYSIISLYINYVNIISINQSTPITLTTTPTIISLNGNEYSLKLLSYSNITTQAVLAITKLPIFVNPTMLIQIPFNNFTDVNLSSKYSTLRIKLSNVSNNHFVVDLIPIPSSLLETPTVQRILFVNNTVPNFGTAPITAIKPISITTNKTTTNKNITSTSNSSSTQTSNFDKAENLLKVSTYYPIMVNYTKMYANESNCTATKYNNTYYNLEGIFPNGTDTYQNITAITPYKLTLNITNSTPSLYDAVYTAYSHSSISNGIALIITMNVISDDIISSTTENAFLSTNSISLESAYMRENRIGTCGTFICSSSKGC